MLELCYLCDSKRPLFPLFYQLSVEECKLPENRNNWRNNWDLFAAHDTRIDPLKCLRSLEELLTCSGESHHSRSEVEYRNKIVSMVCHRFPPPAEFEDSQVQGKDRMRKEIVVWFNNAKPFCRNSSGACVISLYGVGGSGKTTVCRTMVDFYRPEFVGKAFLLELPLDGNESMILGECKRAVNILTEASSEVLERCSKLDQVIRQLKEGLRIYRVFLAIDNVSEQSKYVADKILETPFSSGTKVLVTSRSPELLHQMLRHGCNDERCYHAVPNMNREEAMAALLHYANDKNIAKIWSRKLNHVVDLARFEKRWHPLVLRALGLKLGKRSRENNLDTYFSDLLAQPYGGKEGADVLSILKTSYDEIKDEGRKLIFLDVALILPRIVRWNLSYHYNEDTWVKRSFEGVCRWLSIFHVGKSYFEVEEDLRQLQFDGLIDVQREDQIRLGYEDGDRVLRVHDLYVELAEREAAKDRRFLYSGRAGKEPEDVRWAKLERIVLLGNGCDDETLKLIETNTCSNVRLLILERPITKPRWPSPTDWLMRVHGMARLRFVRMYGFNVKGLSGAQKIVWLDLEMCSVEALTDIIEGLTELQVLRVVLCSGLRSQPDLRRHGELRELGYVFNYEDLRMPILGRHANLEVLRLGHSEARQLWSSDAVPKLKLLDLNLCYQLTNCWELSTLTSLRRLYLASCRNLSELPTLARLTNLVHLDVTSCERLTTIPLRNLIKLRTLNATECSLLIKLPHLEALTSLEVLRLSRCKSLEAISPLTNLTKLQILDVSECRRLVELPNLERLTNLETLDFSGCFSLVSSYPLNVSSKLRKLSVEYCCYGIEQSCLSWGISACLAILTNLESLAFTGCDCVVGIPDLSTLADLKNLVIRRCRNLQSAPDFREFVTLETLELTDLRVKPEMVCLSANMSSLALERLSCLSTISDLMMEVTIKEFEFLTKLELTDFSNLWQLRIERCIFLEKLELSHLVNLQRLTIQWCISLEKLELTGLANLRELEIEWCGSLEELDLRELENLKNLTISGSGLLTKLDLSNLANLTELYLGSLAKLKSLTTKGCRSLTKVNLSSHISLTVLDSSSLTNLKHLTISGGGSLSELDFSSFVNLTELYLSSLTNLKNLTIRGCGSLTKVEFNSLPKLKHVTINECGSLTMLDVSELTDLSTLELCKCQSLTKLQYLSQLQNLTELDLSSLTNLYGLELEDCEFLAISFSPGNSKTCGGLQFTIAYN